MKKIISLLFFASAQLTGYAQDFTWVKGTNTKNIAGIYGTQGIPAAANNPGSRHGCAKWTDAAGNLWLFGGEGLSNSTTLCWLNDLWKYDITTNQWTWIRGSNGPNAMAVYGTIGVSAPTNEPGAREFSTSWTDASGNFWMFGGDGFASVPTQTTALKLGDLWKYNPATNEWTWMHGFNTTNQAGVYGTLGVAAPANMPGSRIESGSWADASGNLWLFGGQINPSGYMNDLWKYNISTNQWTWVSGANTSNQGGLYGTINVPSIANIPGGRYRQHCWVGSSNELYLMGGAGFDGSTLVGRLNDLWKYDIIAGTWTWLNGSANVNPVAVYGTQNVPSAATTPGGRFSSAAWKDPYGKFWIFTGMGLTTGPVTDGINDLFKYDPVTNLWTWVKGSSLQNQNGIYGTMGLAANANLPGARAFNTMWSGSTGKLWLFGGEGYDGSDPNNGNLNDLWFYRVPCNPDSIHSSQGLSYCSGNTTSLTSSTTGTGTVNWYSSPTSTNVIATGSLLPVLVGNAGATPTVLTYYTEANSCPLPRTAISITVNPLPTVSVSASHTIICKNQVTSTITASGATTYTWNSSSTLTTATIFTSPTTQATYTVVGTDVNGCTDSAFVSLKVIICPGILEISGTDFQCFLYPNPNSGEFKFKLDEVFTRTELSIINALGQVVFVQEVNSGETPVKSDLPKGVYFYKVILDSNKRSGGKLVVD